MTDSCTLSRICVDHNLTLVNYSIKLVLNLRVKNLTDMFNTEACIKCCMADTDTLHISLTCVVYTLNAVDVVMEFTLDNRLEVRLHVLAGNLNNVCDAVLASFFHLINFRSYNCNLVILNFRSITGMYKLCTVYTGTIELNLHIFTTDDLTLKCRCKCNRDINVCDFDLNITSLKGSSVEFAYVLLNNKALWYAEDVLCLVCDYREAKCDGASSASNYNVIQRSECVNECRNTVHGVFHKCTCISRCYVTEDQSCTKCNRYNVDNCCNIFSKRNNTYVCSGVHASFFHLVNDSSNQCYKNTLCLIALYKCNTLFYRWSCSKDNCYTRDVSCYKRYTKFTDHSICKVSIAWLLIWCCSVNIFQNFDELCAKCGSNTGHKCVVQSFLSCHKSFYNAKSLF